MNGWIRQSGSSTTPCSTNVDSGIDDAGAGQHVRVEQPQAHVALSVGQVDARVDAHRRDDVVGDVPDDVPARLAQDRQHVGQVQLALGVVGPQLRSAPRSAAASNA